MKTTIATKESILAKLEELINDIEFKEWAMQIAERSLDSGIVDIGKFEDNYLLPKCLMAAIGREIENQYSPPKTFDRKISGLVGSFNSGM